MKDKPTGPSEERHVPERGEVKQVIPRFAVVRPGEGLSEAGTRAMRKLLEGQAAHEDSPDAPEDD